MKVKTIIELLRYCDPELPITVLDGNGNELPMRDDGPIVTIEGGGAAPAFIAINVRPA